MKYIITLFLFSLLLINTNAQNYQIDFTGSGSSSSIDSIHVLNTVQNTHLTLQSGDILHLLGAVGLTSVKQASTDFNIYPNPLSKNSKIQFFNNREGNVSIEITDITGKYISIYSEYMQMGLHTFEISGLNAGVYTISVSAAENKFTEKIISVAKTTDAIQIKYLSSENVSISENILKNNKATVPMQYNDGEGLLLTAFSGNYTTVSTLTPTQSQTMNFSFAPCSDNDGNNYTVVTIGTQTWMAENLKTTKYNDGTAIPLVTGNTEWTALSTPAYCWHSNDVNNKDIYGAFYNWFVVDTTSNGNKNPCPIGWHVPDSTEWRVLVTLAGGETTAGCKLKATGNTTDQTGLWWTPNVCATNETGFSALPANMRSDGSGSFYPLGVNGFWWGTTDMGGTGDAGYDAFMNYNQQYVMLGSGIKKSGYSVRCIKD